MLSFNIEQSIALSNFTFIDLFAGIGGFRLALESFGAKCVYSSEWDKFASEVYKTNFKESPDGDITKIKESNIPKHDILCAGFPCQAFSISGKMKGFDDTRGTLFFDIARIVAYHKPKILLLENVKNFQKHDNGRTLKVVLNTLSNLGYSVYFKILNASDFAIPQLRERLFIVCFLNELKVNDFEFPKPVNRSIKVEDILLNDNEIDDYIINRTDIQLFEDKFPQEDIFGQYPKKTIRIGIVNKGGQGERIYSIKGQALTLTAHGGGIGAKTGLYLVNNKIRKLAPRECARLMGFPDNFQFAESSSQAYKQFGNSVVVDVVQHIIIKIIEGNILNGLKETGVEYSKTGI